MKIGVSASGPSIDSAVDPRFGGCQHMVFIEMNTMACEPCDNTGARALSAAGVATAQLVANSGVKVVLTGEIGPKAKQALAEAGVQIVTGVSSGRVRDAVEAYRVAIFGEES